VCPGRMHFRVAELEDKIWHEVMGVLKDPGRLREGLERMIERERGKQDPAEGMERLARLLDEIEGKRTRSSIFTLRV
jgi:hypothetical protein